ncbi:adenylate/guanylate cyclase domain-containing protein [Arcicella sp. LKC2W]|uniref:adenylate/guanylate cyclase domain-containing protein n=1 Tax=Arcicella sp. LKC2W TaxID=2984198 RepID=UPI002B216188|nr:adenylate/guanylate cyclase domain-containing protein [Arcicella sp. LKC2W]MEA5461116.1 adenylate/guanylate cyclase domain-containing protein [Arcicella sp. LKC2W]
MKSGKMYILFFLFLIAGTKPKVFGQNNNTNGENSQDKKIADSLVKCATKYQDTGNLKQALALFENSLTIYKSIGENQKIGECLNNIGILHYYQGNVLNALRFFRISLNAYKKAGYKKGISAQLNNMGGVYYYLGNYPKALEYYKQAVIVQEELGDKKITAALTKNIGGIYSKVEDYINAMKYFNSAFLIYKSLNDEKAIAQCLNSMGFVYSRQSNYKKAFENLSQALTIADKEKDKQIKVEVLSNLGELFYKQSDFKKALSYYNICLKDSKEINSLQYKSDSHIAIGNIYHQIGKNKESVDKCKVGLSIAEKLGAVSVEKDACECLYKSYKSLGKNQLALTYYEKVNIFEDSLHSEETSSRMMNMEFQKQQLVDSIAYVKKQNLIDLKHKEEVQKKEKQRNIIIVSLLFMLVVAGGLWSSLNFVRKSREALRIEKDRSEELLLNILPAEIADELKEKGSVNAQEFNLVSILFTDFKSFTQTAEKMTPQSLVEEINVCFKAFDLIVEKYKVEKIKTIGDAYMAAGGIPHPDENSTKNIVLAGLEMQEFVTKRVIENEQKQIPFFEMRLGIHAGPIVAGIVGVKKFQYDVWGDAVNTASRIESNGMVGKVNISETLYDLIKDDECFTFEYRGNIHAKGKGEIKMYFVEKKKPMNAREQLQADELVFN